MWKKLLARNKQKVGWSSAKSSWTSAATCSKVNTGWSSAINK